MLPQFFGHVELIDGKPRNVEILELSAEKVTPPVDPACKMKIN
jgi:hypothetical protein